MRTWLEYLIMRKNGISSAEELIQINNETLSVMRSGIAFYDPEQGIRWVMAGIASDMIRGNTDTILLRFLCEKDSYGYEINKQILKCVQKFRNSKKHHEKEQNLNPYQDFITVAS